MPKVVVILGGGGQSSVVGTRLIGASEGSFKFPHTEHDSRLVEKVST